MANGIVWFDSSEAGAPVLNNAAGSLDAVLLACLVTGFRVQTLTSITVSAGVATCTLAGHAYTDQRMVTIGGATPAALNGPKLVTVTGTGVFTFPAPGVADGAATGTITARRTPLGWVRPLSSGNVSIYARTDPAASAMALRVDDTGAAAARVRMVETYGADVNTYGAFAPTEAQVSGGGFWSKGANTATAKRWFLVGDGRTFYLMTDNETYPAASNSNALFAPYGFGDVNSWRAGDAYGCMLSAGSTVGQCNGLVGNGVGMWLSRISSGLGSAVTSVVVLYFRTTYFMGRAPQTYPSPVDNGVPIVYPVPINELNAPFGNPVRGTLRGIADIYAAMESTLALTDHAFGRRLTGVAGSRSEWWVQSFQHAATYGAAAFDLEGPW